METAFGKWRSLIFLLTGHADTGCTELHNEALSPPFLFVHSLNAALTDGLINFIMKDFELIQKQIKQFNKPSCASPAANWLSKHCHFVCKYSCMYFEKTRALRT